MAGWLFLLTSEPTIAVQALKEAVKKLNPQAQWRNPVMFIV
ncbi:hypothetical protein ACUOFC_08800, partial [Escherichia sp. TWPC-MK]